MKYFFLIPTNKDMRHYNFISLDVKENNLSVGIGKNAINQSFIYFN